MGRIRFIVVVCIVVFLSSIFLVFYPLRFDFYELSRAKSIVDLFFLPTIFFFLLIYIVKTIKRGDVNWNIFPKELLLACVVFGIFYSIILRSVLSCGLLFVNCVFEEKEMIEIRGTITHIVKVEGHGKVAGCYEITVSQNGKSVHFDSNKTALESFSLHDDFKIEMKKGILNIIYK